MSTEKAELKLVLSEEGQATQRPPDSPGINPTAPLRDNRTIDEVFGPSSPPPRPPSQPAPSASLQTIFEELAESLGFEGRRVGEIAGHLQPFGKDALSAAGKGRIAKLDPSNHEDVTGAAEEFTESLVKSVGKQYVKMVGGDKFKAKLQEVFAKHIKDVQDQIDEAFHESIDEKAQYLADRAKYMEEVRKAALAKMDPDAHLSNLLAGAIPESEKQRERAAEQFAKHYQPPQEVIPTREAKAKLAVDAEQERARDRAAIQNERIRRGLMEAPEVKGVDEHKSVVPKGRDTGQDLFDLGFLASVSGHQKLGGIMGGIGKGMSMLGAGEGAAAGAGAAGLSGAAAAAGPIGAIVMAAKELNDMIADTSRKATRQLFNDAGKAAALDPSIFMDKFEGAVEQASKLLGPVMGPAITETVTGLRKFNDELMNTAHRLANFSPDIAGAEARSEMRQVMGDMRRAQRLGGDLSRLTDANSRLSQSGQDALAALLAPFLKRFAHHMEKLADIAERVEPGVEVIAKIIEAWFAASEENQKALLIGVEAVAHTLNATAIENLVKRLRQWWTSHDESAEHLPEEILFPLLNLNRMPGSGILANFDPAREAVDRHRDRLRNQRILGGPQPPF